MSRAPLFRPAAAGARVLGADGAARMTTGGDPNHNLVLTDAERADPILACVSRARSDELVIGS